MIELRLEFKTPVFNQGLNVTVRRGHKWVDSKGQRVQLWGNGQSHGEVIITAVYPGRFCDLFDNNYPMQTDFLRLEHDPTCHNVAGLRKAMIAAYPDFDDDDDVCVVEFFKQ